MTTPAPESGPDARQCVSDGVTGVDVVTDGGDRAASGRGGLRPLAAPEREGRGARAASPAGGGEPPRRLRVAPAVQLELGSERDGAAVWAGLPEPSRQAVLALLGRLIGAGAIEEEAS